MTEKTTNLCQLQWTPKSGKHAGLIYVDHASPQFNVHAHSSTLTFNMWGAPYRVYNLPCTYVATLNT